MWCDAVREIAVGSGFKLDIAWVVRGITSTGYIYHPVQFETVWFSVVLDSKTFNADVGEDEMVSARDAYAILSPLVVDDIFKDEYNPYMYSLAMRRYHGDSIAMYIDFNVGLRVGYDIRGGYEVSLDNPAIFGGFNVHVVDASRETALTNTYVAIKNHLKGLLGVVEEQ